VLEAPVEAAIAACCLFLAFLIACALRPTAGVDGAVAASKKLIQRRACSQTSRDDSAKRSICGRIFDDTMIWQSEKL
jgi:hypothetical protein